MEAIAMALFVTILVWRWERRNSPVRDQPCSRCGKTITWRGLPQGFVHKDTGRQFEPYTFAEWDDLWQNKGYRIADLVTPHAAEKRWDPEVPLS